MKVVLPHTLHRTGGVRLAPRPASLRGKRIGFLDGWGRRLDDGSYGMYPLMEALRELLVTREGVGNVVWLRKPSISKRAPKEQIADLVSRADVVVNGEAA